MPHGLAPPVLATPHPLALAQHTAQPGPAGRQGRFAEYVISAQNAIYNEAEKNWKLEKIEEISFDET